MGLARATVAWRACASFKGSLPYRRLSAIHRRARLRLNSKLRAPWPNGVIEAMACGLPFVATRLGCIEEMAPCEQWPYLVPVDDADALAEAIIALAQDADARREVGTAVRRAVEARFSLDEVADRYVELCRYLLAER